MSKHETIVQYIKIIGGIIIVLELAAIYLKL